MEKRAWQVGIGVVIAAAVGAVVIDSMGPGAGGAAPTLSVDVEAEVGGMGGARFTYAARLSAWARPAGQGRACLIALGRSGELLAPGRELTRKGEAWHLEEAASTICGGHVGPADLIALEGGSCQEAAALVARVRGAERPLDVVASVVESSAGWRWGSARVYLHDKLP